MMEYGTIVAENGAIVTDVPDRVSERDVGTYECKDGDDYEDYVAPNTRYAYLFAQSG